MLICAAILASGCPLIPLIEKYFSSGTSNSHDGNNAAIALPRQLQQIVVTGAAESLVLSRLPQELHNSNSRGGTTVSKESRINVTAGKCRSNHLKEVLRLTALLMFSVAITTQGFATPKNLIAGVGPLKSATKWDGRTAFSVIPGAALFPTTSTTTVLQIAFTGGTRADIGNMVLYQTNSRDGVITAVTPVTLNKLSNPSIDLKDPGVCPDQPVSTAAPCIVKLDQLALPLSASSDYYLAIFFPSPDSSNASLSLGTPQFFGTGLTGFVSFVDDTKHLAGDTLNTLINAGTPFGLIAVTSN